MRDEKKSAGLEARLAAETRPLLKEAADLQCCTLSDFVIASAREAAEHPVARNKEIQLTAAEQKRFATALVNPPPVAPALCKAMKNRERLLDQS